MKSFLLLCVLAILSGCASTSNPIDMKGIRNTTQEIRYTNDEIFNLWTRGARWGREFREL